jgi:integrase
MALTATEVQGAKVQVVDGVSKPYKMFDGGGLYLHVTETGSKLWRYQFRLQGKQSIASLGKFPQMSLASAREAHRKATALVAEGVNPTTARKAQEQAQAANKAESFASVAGLWLDWWKTNKSNRHVEVTASRLNRIIVPKLGAVPVNDITQDMLVDFAKKIEAESGREIADRCLMVIGQILRWAVQNKRAKQNVHLGIIPSEILTPAKVVNFAKVDESELPGLLQAIEVYRGTPLARLGMKLMAYTLMRTNELLGLQWSDVCLDCDNEAPKITIPGDRMKAGRDHVIPLSRQAVECLRLLKVYRDQVRYTGSYVFFGVQGAVTMSNMTLLLMLKRMGYQGKMTGHGWRSVASTILNERGYNRDWVEMALAHTPQGVRHAYNKALYLDGRREMLQWYADHLDSLRSKQ